MDIANIAAQFLERIESTGVPYMLVGAIAAGAHGIPRSTRDVDFLVPVTSGGGVNVIIRALDDIVIFEQGTDTLDMPYIQSWCSLHKTTDRLDAALARIPPL